MTGSQSTTPCATLCEAFHRTANDRPERRRVTHAGDGVRVSWADYAHRVRRIAAGLGALGMARGDTVALMSTNRPEFRLVDTAALHLGATPFSIYNTNSPEQINYPLAHAESRVVVCENQDVKPIRDTGYRIDHLVCVDGDIDGGLSLPQLEEASDPGFDFEATWKSVQPADIVTLIYTSDTTGPPKAVDLMHANLLAQLCADHQIFDFRFGDRLVSYCRRRHIADRLTAHYVQLGFGTQGTCVADGRAVAETLRETRPTIWFAVPRIWEKLKLTIESSLGESDTATAKFARRAIETGLCKLRGEQADQPIPRRSWRPGWYRNQIVVR